MPLSLLLFSALGSAIAQIQPVRSQSFGLAQIAFPRRRRDKLLAHAQGLPAFWLEAYLARLTIRVIGFSVPAVFAKSPHLHLWNHLRLAFFSFSQSGQVMS
jgi:hypothetical protein